MGRIRTGIWLLVGLLAVAASADTLVVLNKEAASAWLLDPVTGETRAQLAVGDGPHEAAVSPDGRIAVVANYGGRGRGGNSLSVVDVAAGELVREIDIAPHRRPHGIVFRDARHLLVTSEASSRVLEVDVEAGSVTRSWDAGGDIHMLGLDPERGRIYATAIQRGALSVMDLARPQARARLVETGAGTEALALRPGGAEVWVGNNREHTVTVIDAERLEPVASIEVGLQPIRLTFTPDGRYALATCLLSGDLAVIDAGQRKLARRVALSSVVLKESEWRGVAPEQVRSRVERVVREGARPIGVLVAPGGREAYVANRGLDHIAVVDLETWRVVRRLPTGKGPDGMAWSAGVP